MRYLYFNSLVQYYNGQTAAAGQPRIKRLPHDNVRGASVCSLSLPNGAEVHVGVRGYGAEWFDLFIPRFGNVRLYNQELVAPIHDVVGRYLMTQGVEFTTK